MLPSTSEGIGTREGSDTIWNDKVTEILRGNYYVEEEING